MYLYQPCLLSMSLYAWAFEGYDRKKHWLRILSPLVILAVSEWELKLPWIHVYPAAVLLTVMLFTGRVRTVNWLEMLVSSLVGGLLSWKVADVWPLLPGLILVCAMMMLIPPLILCRHSEDRLPVFALGSSFFELFFCIREYMLFSFCMIRLGSRQSLDLCTSSIVLYTVVEKVCLAIREKKKHAAAI